PLDRQKKEPANIRNAQTNCLVIDTLYPFACSLVSTIDNNGAPIMITMAFNKNAMSDTSNNWKSGRQQVIKGKSRVSQSRQSSYQY
ncbi:hypothetical protein, partial [Escherichia coli]|uniref:hypothetical protein n=1 Tax=Escherichia coli TaxID=562 RepID=UPI001A7E3FC5